MSILFFAQKGEQSTFDFSCILSEGDECVRDVVQPLVGGLAEDFDQVGEQFERRIFSSDTLLGVHSEVEDFFLFESGDDVGEGFG